MCVKACDHVQWLLHQLCAPPRCRQVTQPAVLPVCRAASECGGQLPLLGLRAQQSAMPWPLTVDVS